MDRRTDVSNFTKNDSIKYDYKDALKVKLIFELISICELQKQMDRKTSISNSSQGTQDANNYANKNTLKVRSPSGKIPICELQKQMDRRTGIANFTQGTQDANDYANKDEKISICGLIKRID